MVEAMPIDMGTAGAPELRKGAPGDAAACAAVCYAAFRAIALRHGFEPDFASEEQAVRMLTAMLRHPGFYGVVAEKDGRIVGSNFLDERGPIVGLGPVSVDPALQDGAVGRRMMEHALARVRERGAPGVRLVQAAYHTRSLALYAKLGFAVRESLVVLQGEPIGAEGVPAGRTVRAASDADLTACDALCTRVHGYDRHGELADAVRVGSARVVEHAGRLSGYATGAGFPFHAVAEENADLMALLSDAPAFVGPGFLLPARNGEVLAWALGHGLRVGQVTTLMSLGKYQEPRGAWLPSILY